MQCFEAVFLRTHLSVSNIRVVSFLELFSGTIRTIINVFFVSVPFLSIFCLHFSNLIASSHAFATIEKRLLPFSKPQGTGEGEHHKQRDRHADRQAG